MKKRTVVYLVLGVLIVAAGSIAVIRSRQPADQGQLPEGEVIQVQKGTLTLDVNATGSVALESRVSLSFKNAGRIATRAAKEGERVKKGQVLAAMETDDLQQAVLQAEAGLSSAQAQLAKVRAGSRAEQISAAEAALGIARAGVKAAEAAVTAAQGNLAAAQATSDSAQASLAKLRAGATPQDIRIAEKRIEQAKNDLWSLQAQRDAIGGGKDYGRADEYEAAKGRVASAETAVEIAQIQLEQLKAGPRRDDLAIAQAQVAQAQANVRTAEAQVAQSQAQVESAQAQVKQAEAQLDLLKAGSVAQDIAIAQAQVAQAQAALSQARSALQEAELVAPLDGLIAQVNVELDELVSPGQPVMLLVDDSTYHITVSIDETDISRVNEGQEVGITLDAFPDAELQGKIVRVAPVADLESGVVSYKVRVDIVASSAPLREGLTANAIIITQSLQDVLLVPNSAIYLDEKTGARFVDRVTGDSVELVQISTGAQTDLMSQVTDGLRPGDQVLVRGTSYRERFSEVMKSTFTQSTTKSKK